MIKQIWALHYFHLGKRKCPHFQSNKKMWTEYKMETGKVTLLWLILQTENFEDPTLRLLNSNIDNVTQSVTELNE